MADAGIKRALVIGCAEGVWSEVDWAQSLCEFDTIYCVKLAGVHWQGGRFVWVGLHPEFMEKYRAERAALGLHSDYETVGPLPNEVGRHGHHHVDRRVTYRWPGMNASASSGIYGAKIALDDGHDRVVLAGVPMTQEAGHFTRGKPWAQRACFMIGFDKAVPFLMGKVRSMSGHTQDILGRPDPDWLNGVTP